MRIERSAGYLALVLAVVTAGCQPAVPERAEDTSSSAESESSAPENTSPDEIASLHFAGSKTCRGCHEDFFRLWATSFHGLAMQTYTPEFAHQNLTPQTQEIVVGRMRYQVVTDDRGGRVLERGPDGERAYAIEQVMGGKNVYYFLTPMERGRLQVLPVAYDVHKKTWYDTTASGVRHFPDRRDEALHWTDRMFTFNTTCFNCHVSQLSTNYDLVTDSYATTWSEPGIACESCHGPAIDHVREMQVAGDLQKVSDIKIIRTKEFTTDQMNEMCATCHAKLVPLSLNFRPGDRLFDHFDLILLEHPDYYPDGRDLGENYTYTSWMMNPCARSGQLDCNHCHTPSGRPRFAGTEGNRFCAPCHQAYVDDPVPHGHHAAGSTGNDCVGCHMPMTRFAGMGRTDHSMLPPTPEVTIAFQSPNACNNCHTDKDAAWSDAWVQQWYARGFQMPAMERASLIDAARKRDWERLPELLERITSPEEDVVVRASLVRLIRACPQESKWPVLEKALEDTSPLVRASAVSSLRSHLTGATIPKLLAATRDPFRLVRIRAAMTLAPVPVAQIRNSADRESLERAVEEFKTAMQSRPDDWAGHANLGTFFMERGEFPTAAECFETAIRLEPRMVGPMVNASMAYSNMRQNDKAESILRHALEVEPNHPAALFNFGLLMAEEQRPKEAENALRAAWKADPQMAAAAFNLGVLCGRDRIDEAVQWCQRAHEAEPANAKYAHTFAYFLQENGAVDRAIEVLRELIDRPTSDLDPYLLLAEIFMRKGDQKAAVSVYRQILALPELPADVRKQVEAEITRVTDETAR